MYTQDELKRFIANPPTHVEVETAVDLAKQLLQEKQLNTVLLNECNETVMSVS